MDNFNDGFSAGIVAGVILPMVRIFKGHKGQGRQKYYLKKKTLIYQKKLMEPYSMTLAIQNSELVFLKTH